MNLFDVPQARHFCAPLAQAVPGLGQSLATFHAGLPRGTARLQEGSQRFDVHRVSLLNAVERWILYSVVHYRRALDMFAPVSAPWAQVTLYYSSFFAANAILGMFGAWIGVTRNGTRFVEVERGTPHHQQLRIHRRLPSPNRATGSHRVFWDFFYDAGALLMPWSPVTLTSALQPVNNDVDWQISSRNDVNYDMFHAWEASSLFHSTFNARRFRKTLSGDLALQVDVTERLVRLAVHFADTLEIASFGLEGCGVSGSRTQIQRSLVKQSTPSLVTQSALMSLLGDR